MTDTVYFDKVYGGWLGKCLGGAAGAPVEGIKKLIPCEDFREMIRPDLPNDDLDLQLLWLEVLQKKGRQTTAADLADAWNRQCWYPFNEYGIFLKNYERGILPPYSGSFNNPLFCEGEGCPIRSEIWGMIFPGDGDTAADYAGMDGSLDHAGEAVWIEQYYAAVEAMAFTDETRSSTGCRNVPGECVPGSGGLSESRMESLLRGQLHRLPEDSRARACTELVMETFREEPSDWVKARTRMLRRFGHFDFTNAVTNLGITVISLLYGGENLWKVINIAFRCGYDTDCTCATAAAIWGILHGADHIPESLKALVNDQFVIGIALKRTDCSIRKLSEETCELGKRLASQRPRSRLTGHQNSSAASCGVSGLHSVSVVAEQVPLAPSNPRGSRQMSMQAWPLGSLLRGNELCEKKMTHTLDVLYIDRPAIGLNDRCRIGIRLKNHFPGRNEWNLRFSGLPAGWRAVPDTQSLVLEPGEEKTAQFSIETTSAVKVLYGKNLLTAVAWDGTQQYRRSFGIAGAAEWTAAGPYFENLEKDDPPGTPSPHGEGCNLPTLECMVNNAVYLDKAYMDELDFGQAFSREETCLVHGYEDLLPLDEAFPFQGQGCIYLKQRLISDREQDVWAVIGNNDGFRLWVNEKPCLERDEIRLWTPYNNHQIVHLKKGVNEIVVKVLKRTESIKFSIAFRKYEGEHFHRKRWCVDLGCEL